MCSINAVAADSASSTENRDRNLTALGSHTGSLSAIMCHARDRPPSRRAVAPGRRAFSDCRKHLWAALATARDRGASALELRAAADLRRLELANGRTGDATSILRFAVEKFTEGNDLPDLQEANELLR
jgi:hypothetical protein